MIKAVVDHIQISLVFAVVILIGFEFASTWPLTTDAIVRNQLPIERMDEVRPASLKEYLGLMLSTIGLLFLVVHIVTHPLDTLRNLFSYDSNSEIIEEFEECGLVAVTFFVLVLLEISCLVVVFVDFYH